MKEINTEEVRKIATLANLQVEDDQLDNLARDMAKIIDYIDQLKRIDTAAVEPTYYGSDNINVWREDTVQESLKRDDVLKNAQRHDLVNIRTKGVFK
ncbi:MAG TPA: Asp-tRNA(Asn)/Glu-tRNA(Gln) amidotransferase subunit GatC [bacterium]|nr:Asp-tRNA(Asn)/Glu-tRNA(Gln) amidotransferase subunit GatC [bacterium]HPN67535.1 Asp-tRNA(Asn)/Glu-tRNA(Gln) amidotransferase subunit GatC [bacterium]